MSNFLTSYDLKMKLYKLRNTLCGYDYTSLDNVIFFNNDAVYEYLCEIKMNDDDETIGDCLNVIGAYIPITLTDYSLKFIMQSANSPEHISELDEEFTKKNRMEFLQMISKADGPVEWSSIINLCETIRAFRVKDEMAAF